MGSLTTLNTFVIIAVMLLITWLGRMASRAASASSRSFFTADGQLPWWAVSASLYATAISAVSFVSIPASVFRPGGNLELAQVDMGSAAGKLLAAIIFVRAFYYSRSVDTVYEYLEARINAQVAGGVMVVSIVASLFVYGVVVVAAALVLDVLTELGVAASCIAIVGLSALWSWLGGIRIVVWTDFLMLCIFVLGVILSIWLTFSAAGLALPEAYLVFEENAKLRLFDFSVDPSNAYTVWTALFSATLSGMFLMTSQSGMQRVRACKSRKDAHKAIVFSIGFYAMSLALYIVGLGLFIFYDGEGMSADLTARLASQPDQVYPYYIVHEIPDGLSGLLIAAIFAAAISTLNSRLAELSNVAVDDIYRRYFRKNATEAHYVSAARWFILFWAIVFCGMAMAFSMVDGRNLYELTFEFWNVIVGPIVAVFLIARVRLGDTLSIVVGFLLSLCFAGICMWADVTNFWNLTGAIVIMFVVAWLRTPRAWEPTGIVETDLIENDADSRDCQPTKPRVT